MTSQFPLFLFFCLSASLLFAQNENAETIIRTRIAEFSRHLVAQDFDAVANAYTEDARIFMKG